MQRAPDSSRAGDSFRVRLVTLAGIAVSVGCVWLAFHKLEFTRVAEAMAAAELWPWIPLAMLSYLVGHAVRGLRLRKLVSLETDLPLGTATNIVVLGYGVNNILPARMGEFARAGLLSDRVGTPYTQSLTVTFLERVLDGWTTLLLLLFGIALVSRVDHTIIQTAYLSALLFGGASLGILLMAAFPDAMASLASRLAGSINPNWHEPVWRRCLYISNGMVYLKRPLQALQVGLLSIVVWLFETGMFLMVMPAFGLPARFDWAVLTMAVTNLGTVVPSTPGFIGPYHYFCMQTLMLLGVTSVTASTYAITVHAVFYIPITLWGMGVLTRYGIELGRMTVLARDAKREAATTLMDGVPMVVLGTRTALPASDKPGQLILALTEALLPADTERAPEVNLRVATFVQGQVNALPPVLRVLLFVGLFGFRVLVRIRYLRGYCELPLSTRKTVANAWAYGRYALTRQLFRVLRSTALLRYYEGVDEPKLIPLGTAPLEAS